MPTALEIIVPGLTALGGSALGARWSAIGREHAELRSLLDEATAALERTSQASAEAIAHARAEGVKTTPAGVEALDIFRRELSEAQQLRGKITFRTRRRSPVAVHYLNALLAIGSIWHPLSLLAVWPHDQPPPFDRAMEVERARAAQKDFTGENGKFIEAAQAYFKPSPGERLRRLLFWR